MDTSPRESATAGRICHLVPGKPEDCVSVLLVGLSSVQKNISDYCSLPSRQKNLCSNLCSGASYCDGGGSARPCGAMDLNACATWPKPQGTPDIQATLLYAGLTLAGAMQLRDFEGLTSTEAMAIWSHLRETPVGFVGHLFSCLPRALLAQARRYGEVLPGATQQVQRRVAESGLPKQLTLVVDELTNGRDRTPPRAQSAPGLETLKWCMKSLRTARTFKMAPPPSAFARSRQAYGHCPVGGHVGTMAGGCNFSATRASCGSRKVVSKSAAGRS